MLKCRKRGAMCAQLLRHRLIAKASRTRFWFSFLYRQSAALYTVGDCSPLVQDTLILVKSIRARNN